jgi:hypothetical protein
VVRKNSGIVGVRDRELVEMKGCSLEGHVTCRGWHETLVHAGSLGLDVDVPHSCSGVPRQNFVRVENERFLSANTGLEGKPDLGVSTDRGL